MKVFFVRLGIIPNFFENMAQLITDSNKLDKDSKEYCEKQMRESFSNLKIIKGSLDSSGYKQASSNAKKCFNDEKFLKSLYECDKENMSFEKKFTTKVTFNPAGKPYTRAEVIEAMENIGVSSQEIVALGTMSDNSKWLITLGNEEVISMMLTKPPVVRDYESRVIVFNSNIVKLRVHWLPVYIPMSSVVCGLSEYGICKSVAWDYSNIPGCKEVRTTVRNIIMKLDVDAVVPAKIKILFDQQYYDALITIPGRGPVCFRCNKIGHRKNECIADYCRHCLNYEHSTIDCAIANSYAKRLGAFRPGGNVKHDADVNDEVLEEDQGKKSEMNEQNVDNKLVNDEQNVDNETENGEQEDENVNKEGIQSSEHGYSADEEGDSSVQVVKDSLNLDDENNVLVMDIQENEQESTKRGRSRTRSRSTSAGSRKLKAHKSSSNKELVWVEKTKDVDGNEGSDEAW